MSSFVLLLVIVSMKGIGVVQEGAFDTMDECFDAREQLVERVGRPIFNYQAVCVHWVDDPEKFKEE